MSVRCPLCDVTMREVDRRGVHIDVCPECRGVWLDRGELDKLLAGAPAEEPAEYGLRRRPGYDRDDDFDDDDDDFWERSRRDYGGSGDEGKRRRKRSWFEDFFDFD
ncbi:MAG TPA: zf-TFIIB domain-containing protein [Dehalococcoidia bacterium]